MAMSRGAAAYFTEKWFGGPVHTVIRAVNVTTAAAVELLKENPDRIGWLIQNIGTNTGYYSFDRAPGSTNGFRLPANGSVASKQVQQDGESTAYAVSAISDIADTVWMVEEIIGKIPPGEG